MTLGEMKITETDKILMEQNILDSILLQGEIDKRMYKDLTKFWKVFNKMKGAFKMNNLIKTIVTVAILISFNLVIAATVTTTKYAKSDNCYLTFSGGVEKGDADKVFQFCTL